MKRALNKISKVILISTIFITSCSKGKNDPIEFGGEGETISFVLDGVEGGDEINVNSGSVNESSTKQNNDVDLLANATELERVISQPKGSGINVVASSYEMSPKLVHSNLKAQQGSSNKLRAATTPMAGTMKYRILLFDNNDNFLKAIDGTVGSVIPSYTGYVSTTYKWKAYSYNTAAAITPAASSITSANIGSNINVSYTNAQDFLYASGTITTSTSTSSKVNIVFKRQRAAVEIVLSTRGISDRIQSVTGTVTGIPVVSTSTFNLKDSTRVLGTSSTINRNFNLSNLSNLYAGNDTIKSFKIYTLDPNTAITSYGVNISQMSAFSDLYNLDGNPTNVDTRSRIFIFAATPFNFNKSFTPELGKNYKIILDFLSRTKNLSTSSSTSTVEWSFTNLYFHSNKGYYGFRHSNDNAYDQANVLSAGGVGRAQEYFNWKAAKPGFAEATNVIDPCTKVYPYNRWRMPTYAEFSAIRDVPTDVAPLTPRRSNAQANPYPGRYIDVVLGNGDSNPYYYQNGMALQLYGYRNAGNTTYTNYNTDNSTLAGVYFWASDNLGTANANYFFITNTSDSYSAMTTASASSASTFPRTNGLSIRCVQNSSFNLSLHVPNIKQNW